MDAHFMFHTIDPVLSLRFQPVSGLHFKLFKIHYILLGKTDEMEHRYTRSYCQLDSSGSVSD